VAFKKADERERSQATEVLIDLGWLRPAPGYRKEHHTRFAVNPLLAERFTQIAAREQGRRAVVREQIREAARERQN
jgi:hypothetical protein